MVIFFYCVLCFYLCNTKSFTEYLRVFQGLSRRLIKLVMKVTHPSIFRIKPVFVIRFHQTFHLNDALLYTAIEYHGVCPWMHFHSLDLFVPHFCLFICYYYFHFPRRWSVLPEPEDTSTLIYLNIKCCSNISEVLLQHLARVKNKNRSKNVAAGQQLTAEQIMERNIRSKLWKRSQQECCDFKLHQSLITSWSTAY